MPQQQSGAAAFLNQINGSTVIHAVVIVVVVLFVYHLLFHR